jgi:hypothetical protein
MSRKVVGCVLLVAVIVASIALAVQYAVNQPKPTNEKTFYYNTRSIEGQQTFMVGPDLCNLTWVFKLNQTAYALRYTSYGHTHYQCDYTYTMLYSATVSLVLREVGFTRSNVSQTIFIEPEIQPLGHMTNNGTYFQLMWNGNITSYYANSDLDRNYRLWGVPPVTFNMPYYVFNTTMVGVYSFTMVNTAILN